MYLHIFPLAFLAKKEITFNLPFLKSLKTGVITSVPLGKFIDENVRNKADDPELTIKPYFLSNNLVTFFSNKLNSNKIENWIESIIKTKQKNLKIVKKHKTI